MSEQNSGGATMFDQLMAKGVTKVVESTKAVKTAAKGTKTAPTFSFKQPPVLPKLNVSILTLEQREENRRDYETFVAEMVPQMHDYVTQLRTLADMPDEERMLYAEAEEQLAQAVAAMLSYEEPYRTPARLAWADALVKTCPARRGPVLETLERFVKDGFLVVVENGDQKHGIVRIYGCNYTLAVELRKNQQAGAVLEALNALVGRTVAYGKEVFEDQLVELNEAAGESQLTPAEIRAGKDGRAILMVPDKVREWDGRFFRGGPILVEVHEGRVRILDGAGAVRFSARQIGESGTFLGIGQLANERINLGSTWVPPEVSNRMIAIHDMVRRGLRAAEEAEARETAKADYRARVDREREELRSRATLTLGEFFFEGKTGTVFFDFGRKPFEREKRENGKTVRDREGQPIKEKIWDVFCLVERAEDSQIRVAACPERLKSFFGGAQDWSRPDERFAGVPYPLGVLLRIGFAMAQSGDVKS